MTEQEAWAAVDALPQQLHPSIRIQGWAGGSWEILLTLLEPRPGRTDLRFCSTRTFGTVEPSRQAALRRVLRDAAPLLENFARITAPGANSDGDGFIHSWRKAYTPEDRAAGFPKPACGANIPADQFLHDRGRTIDCPDCITILAPLFYTSDE